MNHTLVQLQFMFHSNKNEVLLSCKPSFQSKQLIEKIETKRKDLIELKQHLENRKKITINKYL